MLLIEKFKDRMPDQKSVEEMEKLMRELEAQVKALQGRVNILTAEKEELQKRVDQLGAENEQLKTQVAQLTSEKEALQAQAEQLAAEKQQLAEQNQLLQAKNQELAQENGNLKAQLQQKRPLMLMARAEDQRSRLIWSRWRNPGWRIPPAPSSRTGSRGNSMSSASCARPCSGHAGSQWAC